MKVTKIAVRPPYHEAFKVSLDVEVFDVGFGVGAGDGVEVGVFVRVCDGVCVGVCVGVCDGVGVGALVGVYVRFKPSSHQNPMPSETAPHVTLTPVNTPSPEHVKMLMLLLTPTNSPILSSS